MTGKGRHTTNLMLPAQNFSGYFIEEKLRLVSQHN